MCGICGIVTKKMSSKYIVKVKEGLEEIRHRGPDDINVFHDANIVFGYVRLAIRGPINKQYNQPIINDNIIAFGNGEFYSKDGKEIGQDTNDLIPLVNELVTNEGKIYDKIDADFAISCYDRKNKIFYLARDFYGVKPLYIAWLDNQTLAFSSEIKALKRMSEREYEFDEKTILDYLIFGYQLEQNTFYKDITTLPPANILKWDLKNGTITNCNYTKNRMKFNYTNVNNNSEIYDEINKSIMLRLKSDQKVGFHLSGGMDSSLIVYLAHSNIREAQKCFTAYINKQDNDLIYSKRICKELKCKQYIMKMKKNNYNELTNVLDTPIMSTGDFVPLKIAELGKKQKVKVMLEGQGADELFLGYSRFKEINNKLSLSKVIDILNNSDINLLKKLFKINVSYNDINSIYNKNFINGNSNIEKAHLFYIRNFLQELLRIEDHVHMKYSIENRVPFLSLYIRNWLNNNKIVINNTSNKLAEYNVHKKINSLLINRKTKENLNGSLNDELINNLERI